MGNGIYTGRDQRECLLPLEARLRKAVGETNALRTLAAIPLLCAAVCALNRARNGFVPEDRLELYQAFCAMLLERREKGAGTGGRGHFHTIPQAEDGVVAGSGLLDDAYYYSDT